MKCAECKFWEKLPLAKTKGFCWRYPPQYVNDYASKFPETFADDKCGEFRDKNKPEVKLGRPSKK
jgi:hypothetical protein